MKNSLFRNKNGRPIPISQPSPLLPSQRSMLLNSPPPDPEPPPPEPETAYDMASQAREMVELVTAFARSYGWHLTPKIAIEIAQLIMKPEHRYNFGEFNET